MYQRGEVPDDWEAASRVRGTSPRKPLPVDEAEEFKEHIEEEIRKVFL